LQRRPTAEAAVHESPLAVLKGLWHELPGLFSDRVELLSLELHRAGLALVQIAALVVAAAILGVTAWLVLWGAAGVLLTQAGLHWLLSLAVVLVLNLVAAWLAVARVRRLLPSLKLPATRRHMTVSPSTQPPTERPDVPHQVMTNPSPSGSPERSPRVSTAPLGRSAPDNAAGPTHPQATTGAATAAAGQHREHPAANGSAQGGPPEPAHPSVPTATDHHDHSAAPSTLSTDTARHERPTATAAGR
jgi:hypothetical protein